MNWVIKHFSDLLLLRPLCQLLQPILADDAKKKIAHLGSKYTLYTHHMINHSMNCLEAPGGNSLLDKIPFLKPDVGPHVRILHLWTHWRWAACLKLASQLWSEAESGPMTTALCGGVSMSARPESLVGWQAWPSLGQTLVKMPDVITELFGPSERVSSTSPTPAGTLGLAAGGVGVRRLACMPTRTHFAAAAALHFQRRRWRRWPHLHFFTATSPRREAAFFPESDWPVIVASFLPASWSSVWEVFSVAHIWHTAH